MQKIRWNMQQTLQTNSTINVKLNYGLRHIQCNFAPEKILAVVEPVKVEADAGASEQITTALRHPVGSKPLPQIVDDKDPQKVAIIVSDITRPIPYMAILPPLLAELQMAGVTREQITFVIATGIHAAHTSAQNAELFGKELLKSYRFHVHDSDASDLVSFGRLSTGNELLINRVVAEADLCIVTGAIAPHYFAGFSGGRKAILPGVAGRQTIEQNHRLLMDMLHQEVPLEKNPVNLEMIEAAQKVGVDFLLNVVLTPTKEIVQAVAGDVQAAWKAGITTCEHIYKRPVLAKADLTIASPGGYPKDLNVYQAQKSLANADGVTRDGGIIILLAECSEGFGEPTFEQWINEAPNPEAIIQRIEECFVLGGHKAFGIARIARKKEIILISALDHATTGKLFMKKYDTLEEAIAYAEQKLSPDYKTIIMPHAGYIHPYLEEPETLPGR